MTSTEKVNDKEKCFVIMPISDPDEYDQGHFQKIYDQIFIPAIKNAGYIPHRVDDDKSSHSIQSSIIKELIEAPMVLCDLSSRNPNVLYELGIRHAYNKPVVLVQENGTERVFDIGGINTIDYHPSRIYDEVLEDQIKIATAITATKENRSSYSLTQLVEISSADISNGDVSNEDRLTVTLASLQNELGYIRKQLNDINYRENIGVSYLSDRLNASDKKQMLINNDLSYNQLLEILSLSDEKMKKDAYEQAFEMLLKDQQIGKNEKNKKGNDTK